MLERWPSKRCHRNATRSASCTGTSARRLLAGEEGHGDAALRRVAPVPYVHRGLFTQDGTLVVVNHLRQQVWDENVAGSVQAVRCRVRAAGRRAARVGMRAAGGARTTNGNAAGK